MHDIENTRQEGVPIQGSQPTIEATRGKLRYLSEDEMHKFELSEVAGFVGKSFCKTIEPAFVIKIVDMIDLKNSDEREAKIKKYNLGDNKSINTVFGIVQDTSGQYWMEPLGFLRIFKNPNEWLEVA